jgi:hypothetical protein
MSIFYVSFGGYLQMYIKQRTKGLNKQDEAISAMEKFATIQPQATSPEGKFKKRIPILVISLCVFVVIIFGSITSNIYLLNSGKLMLSSIFIGLITFVVAFIAFKKILPSEPLLIRLMITFFLSLTMPFSSFSFLK